MISIFWIFEFFGTSNFHSIVLFSLSSSFLAKYTIFQSLSTFLWKLFASWQYFAQFDSSLPFILYLSVEQQYPNSKVFSLFALTWTIWPDLTPDFPVASPRDFRHWALPDCRSLKLDALTSFGGVKNSTDSTIQSECCCDFCQPVTVRLDSLTTFFYQIIWERLITYENDPDFEKLKEPSFD